MHRRVHFAWQLRTRALALGAATQVVGILNVTPDSFSDGGRLRSVEEAVNAALTMFAEGATIVDIGGESTRPGASGALSTQEEMDRVLPVIEGIRHERPDALLSIDTYRAATARAAIDAGAEIVNDVSGMLWDEAMEATCAELGCGVVIMHTRGRPAEWTSLPPLAPEAVVPLVKRELDARLRSALIAGIAADRIVLDPGFGFGKSADDNYRLLAGLPELAALERPLLAGVSRKAFLGRTLAPLYSGANAPASLRGHATIAATTIAILLGASLVRVHEVRPAAEAAAITDAILSASSAMTAG